MPSAERKFAVRCPCSAVVGVTTGQAGTRVICPGCGVPVDVPRLRDLLEAPSPPPARNAHRPGWDTARGLTFAGLAVAVLASIGAAGVVPLAGMLVGRPPSAEQVRRSVAAAPISMVHAAATELAQSGLNRVPSPVELRLVRSTRAARGVSRALWGVAAVAALTAAAGFMLRRSPDHGDAAS